MFILLSCDSSRMFDHSVNIPAEGWHMDSSATFTIEVTDTITKNTFFINLRNNNDYSYRNFYLFLNTTFPDGTLARDTIELILADRTGKWLGKGFGRIRDNQIEVRSELRFPLIGTYIFGIEQAMRDTLLAGIENVGIRIEKKH
jgi:gliding motility-associated lipoprotein GldH